MTVRQFRSTDPSAPVLSGAQGTLTALLDACLVNGYGSRTALGWTKAFSGTNQACYRMATTNGSTGCYLRVDDAIATNFHRAGLTGYVTMSALSTGTDPFNATNNYNGILKSATIDATPRAWVLVGDEYRFYLMIQSADNIAAEWDVYFFGDIFSLYANDAYRCLLGGRYATAINSQTFGTNYMGQSYVYSFTAINGLTMPRNHAGVAPAIIVGFHADSFNCANQSATAYFLGSQGALTYPNSAQNGMFITPIWVHQNTTAPYVVRGYMPGYWAPAHARPLANNDTFSGVGGLAGKTFEAFHIRNNGQVFIETSDTWS